MSVARILVLSLLPLAVACISTTEVRWERPGAAPATQARDMSDCSAIAWTEAERLHPYGLGGPPVGITAGSGGMESRQQIDNERFESANRLTGLCMASRGYTKVIADAR